MSDEPGRVSRPELPAGPYLVAGLAVAGFAALQRLHEIGVPARELAGWDARRRPEAEAVYGALERRGVRLSFGGDPVALLDRTPRPACVVKSPGLPATHALPAAAATRGLPVLDEAELAWRTDPRRWIGVTGTNGKSTVCALIDAALRAEGCATVLAGNIQGGPALSVADPAAEVVVAEISSYQLECSPALLPDLAVLTNLARDHLERHGDVDRYAAVKRRLFIRPGGRVARAVVPTGDRLGRALAAELRAAGAAVSTVGPDRRADVRVRDPIWTLAGTSVTVHTHDGGEMQLRTRSIGPHMAMNAALAFAAARAWGADGTRARAAIADADPVPGRLERVPCPHGFAVLVDFAHNAAGVRASLASARALCEIRGRRLIVVLSILSVFGRPQRTAVGRAAAMLADVVVLTTDRWRAEEPADRLPSGLAAGARAAGGAEVEVVLDRRSAIAHGLALARPGDVVVIAGRGSRATQRVDADGPPRPFDDRVVAAELIATLSPAAAATWS